MKYDYTKSFISGYGYSSCSTISSGIYRVVGPTKNHPASFVRVKSSSCDSDKLQETMQTLCDLLNREIIAQEGFFDSKTIDLYRVRRLLILERCCELTEEGKLKCLK